MGVRNSSQEPVADDSTIRNMPGPSRNTFQRKGRERRREEEGDRNRDFQGKGELFIMIRYTSHNPVIRYIGVQRRNIITPYHNNFL